MNTVLRNRNPPLFHRALKEVLNAVVELVLRSPDEIDGLNAVFFGEVLYHHFSGRLIIICYAREAPELAVK